MIRTVRSGRTEGRNWRWIRAQLRRIWCRESGQCFFLMPVLVSLREATPLAYKAFGASVGRHEHMLGPSGRLRTEIAAVDLNESELNKSR